MTQKPSDFEVRGGEGFWIMENPSPPSNSSTSTLFTAAESESVIKYLVSLTLIFHRNIFYSNAKVGHSIRPYTTGILIPQSASAMVSPDHWLLLEIDLSLVSTQQTSVRCQLHCKTQLQPEWCRLVKFWDANPNLYLSHSRWEKVAQWRPVWVML